MTGRKPPSYLLSTGVRDARSRSLALILRKRGSPFDFSISWALLPCPSLCLCSPPSRHSALKLCPARPGYAVRYSTEYGVLSQSTVYVLRRVLRNRHVTITTRCRFGSSHVRRPGSTRLHPRTRLRPAGSHTDHTHRQRATVVPVTISLRRSARCNLVEKPSHYPTSSAPAVLLELIDSRCQRRRIDGIRVAGTGVHRCCGLGAYCIASSACITVPYVSVWLDLLTIHTGPVAVL